MLGNRHYLLIPLGLRWDAISSWEPPRASLSVLHWHLAGPTGEHKPAPVSSLEGGKVGLTHCCGHYTDTILAPAEAPGPDKDRDAQTQHPLEVGPPASTSRAVPGARASRLLSSDLFSAQASSMMRALCRERVAHPKETLTVGLSRWLLTWEILA